MDNDQDYITQFASGGLIEEELSTTPFLTNPTPPTNATVDPNLVYIIKAMQQQMADSQALV